MEIILSQQCESLTGSLGRGFGYYIKPHLSYRSGKVRFFSQRSKHSVPPDGHWRFIVACAELAQKHLHISDIRVNGREIYIALKEAGIDADLYPFDFEDYNAKWVLDFKTKCGI